MQNTKNMMKHPAILLTLMCCFGNEMMMVVVESQTIREENFPLSSFIPVPCDSIIRVHTFEGDCCALNSTDGNGCILNVINGTCIVRFFVFICCPFFIFRICKEEEEKKNIIIIIITKCWPTHFLNRKRKKKKFI